MEAREEKKNEEKKGEEIKHKRRNRREVKRHAIGPDRIQRRAHTATRHPEHSGEKTIPGKEHGSSQEQGKWNDFGRRSA